MNIEERIALYPELSEEERARVRAYVDEHPEWKPAFDHATRLDELLSAARSLGDDPPSAEAIAYRIATRGLRLHDAPSDVDHNLQSLRTLISRDPELKKQSDQISRRLAELEKAVPAQAQFERLTGHDLNSYSGVEDVSGGAAVFARNRKRSGGASPFVWRIAASLAALIAVYGILFVIGEGLRPDYERLASFEEDELVLDGYDVLRGRGDSALGNSAVDLYLGALFHLSQSEFSYLGLFPSFDDARLDSAAFMLREVIASEPAESFLAGEAAYMLGKTELARGEIGAAREALSQVVALGGRQAEEARDLLSEIEECCWPQ